MSLASDRPEFTPPSTSGRGRAIGLAVLAHAFLIAALTWGVGWKREANNAPVQAELWATTVQQAAPALVEPTPPPQVDPKPEPKVEPPPPPPKPPKPAKAVEPEPESEPKIDPQIAIEKAKKEEKKKLEKKKTAEAKALAKQEAEEEAAEEERIEKMEAAKAKKLADIKAKSKKEAAENAKLDAQRKVNLEKMMKGLAGATGGETATGTTKQSTGPSAGYEGRIMAILKRNLVFAAEISGNPVVTIEVLTSSDGRITNKRILKSSGNKAWDDASLRALEKTEIFPRDVDGRVHSPYEINFRPKDLL